MISRSKSGQSCATRCRTYVVHRADSAKSLTDCSSTLPCFALCRADIERVHMTQGCPSSPYLAQVNTPARRSMTVRLVQVHEQDDRPAR